MQKWVDEGFPPIACHQRPAEHPLNAEGLAAKYPLAAVQRKLRTSVHTIFKNLDTMLDLDGHEPHVYPVSYTHLVLQPNSTFRLGAAE